MTQATQKIERQTFLPEDTKSAANVMINLTRQLLEFVLEESKLLKEKDTLTLARVQKGKELRTIGYTNAAAEFTNRLTEFKDLDEALIGKIEALTVELGKATRENQKLIERLSPKKPVKEHMSTNLFLLQGEEISGTAE